MSLLWIRQTQKYHNMLDTVRKITAYQIDSKRHTVHQSYQSYSPGSSAECFIFSQSVTSWVCLCLLSSTLSSESVCSGGSCPEMTRCLVISWAMLGKSSPSTSRRIDPGGKEGRDHHERNRVITMIILQCYWYMYTGVLAWLSCDSYTSLSRVFYMWWT